MSDNTPVKKFRDGLYAVTIWANTHNDKTYYTPSLEMSYAKEDEAGNVTFHDTKNINADDLHKVAHLLTLAAEWIRTKRYPD